jgi:hypothetical protein
MGPKDEILIEKVTAYLNSLDMQTTFACIKAEEPASSQKLKVATIYKSSKLEAGKVKALKALKDGREMQFGMDINFKFKKDGRSFKMINVHLAGGATKKDE